MDSNALAPTSVCTFVSYAGLPVATRAPSIVRDWVLPVVFAGRPPESGESDAGKVPADRVYL